MYLFCCHSEGKRSIYCNRTISTFSLAINWQIVICRGDIYRNSEIFNTRYFFDKIIQGKIFSWMHDFLEIFLPWMYIGSNNLYSLTLQWWSDRPRSTVIAYSNYTIATPYHIWSCWSCLLCKVRCSLAILSVHTHLSIRNY